MVASDLKAISSISGEAIERSAEDALHASHGTEH